jgi:AcrR family transcriptional regulator
VTERTFQRARTAAQQEQRRRTILDVAREMLSVAPPAEVSLRELSARVGLAKSNVVRYFPTREAVFLAVMLEDWTAWLDDLDARLAPGPMATADVARTVAESLVDHPRFCSLLAATPTVLEHNVPVDTARAYKHGALVRMTRLARAIEAGTTLDATASMHVAGTIWALIAGAWPMVQASPAVTEALEDPELAPLRVDFVRDLGRSLTALLDGFAPRTQG